MSTATFTSMLEAKQILAKELGPKVDYDLVRFLMTDHQIPTERIGRAATKWLPPESLDRLRQAAIEFLAKLDNQ